MEEKKNRKGRLSPESRKGKASPEERRAIVREALGEELADERVLRMGEYIQHGDVTTLAHCLAVAEKSYELAERFGVLDRVDLRAMLRAALLHDFYLYDWHEKDASHRWHGFHHAERAAANARDLLGAGEAEQAIIRSHMWPLNLTKPPRSREGWIVTLADKIVAAKETLRGFRKRRGKSAGKSDATVPENTPKTPHGSHVPEKKEE